MTKEIEDLANILMDDPMMMITDFIEAVTIADRIIKAGYRRPQPLKVVWPKEKECVMEMVNKFEYIKSDLPVNREIKGWNAAISEFKRLNPGLK